MIENNFSVEGLLCEYIKNPLGIDESTPRFSWRVESGRRGWKQTAYRIIVAEEYENYINNIYVWESRTIKSDRSINVAYDGADLKAKTRYYWNVQVWDNFGETAQSSQNNWFETGLMGTTWDAQWIGGGDAYLSTWSLLFRKEFDVNKKIKSARAYISGLGFYELYLNGNKVGDHVLDPGQTDYEARVFYVTYDITEMLNEGCNAVGIMLGDGWYHQSRVWSHPLGGKYFYGDPMAKMILDVLFEDGSSKQVTTDTTWKVNRGAITQNNVYAGETYDARLECISWNMPGCDESTWKFAAIADAPTGKLVPQMMPPIKTFEIIDAVKILEPVEGVFTIDFGQNIAGWTMLKVIGMPGTEITLRFAEHCINGRIDTNSCGTSATRVIQTMRYICKGGKEPETYEPHFTYFGFRYVEVEGLIEKPTADTIKAVRVHTAVEEAAGFECSYEKFNILHKMMRDTVLSNLHSIPTDCPVREKCGWTGDAWAMADVMMANWDMSNFFRKYVQDIECQRQVYGEIMNIVPGKRHCLDAGPAWGTAQVMIPWDLYKFYGDIRILEEHYTGMVDWIEHLNGMAIEFVISNLKYELDDWCPPEAIKMGVTSSHFATACLYLCALKMANIAKVLNKFDDEFYYKHLSNQVLAAFNKNFYNEEACSYGTQAIDSFALYFGLVPEVLEEKVASSIAQSIIYNDYHVMVGHIGIKYIFFILNRYGYKDLIYKVFDNDTQPGLSNLIKKGATTLYESWESDGRSGSLSHPFKGGYDLWYINDLLGLRIDPEVPAFKRFVVKVDAPDFITHASGWYNCLYGTIEIEWTKTDDHFTLALCVPPNCTAHVYLPVSDTTIISEYGNMDCTKVLEREGHRILVEVSSGIYEFTSKIN